MTSINRVGQLKKKIVKQRNERWKERKVDSVDDFIQITVKKAI